MEEQGAQMDMGGGGVPAQVAEYSAPTESRHFEAMDAWDADQMMAEIEGKLGTDDFYYSFQQGGQTIAGLSWKGVKAIVQSMSEAGFSFSVELMDKTTEDDRVEVMVSVTRTAPNGTSLSMIGVSSEPVNQSGGRRDKFCLQKAMSKAQRNGYRAVIPEHVLVDSLQRFLGQGRGSRRSLPQDGPRQESRQLNSAPPVAERAPGEKKEFSPVGKMCFAIVKAISEQLDSNGVTEDDFWAYVRHYAGVANRTDIRDETWRQIGEALRRCQDKDRNPIGPEIASLADRIKAAPAYVEAHGSSEVDPDDDIPFSDGVSASDIMEVLDNPDLEERLARAGCKSTKGELFHALNRELAALSDGGDAQSRSILEGIVVGLRSPLTSPDDLWRRLGENLRLIRA